jgi:hypothetical protein
MAACRARAAAERPHHLFAGHSVTVNGSNMSNMERIPE